MPNWAPLHAAILRDVPNARRLALIQQAETWLGLPLETALKACAGAAPDEATAREVNAALGLVMAAQRRDLGMPDGPAGIPRFQELAAAYQAGTLEPALRRTWERGGIAFQLWMAQRETFPAIASPPPPLPDEPALRATLAALQERQFAAQQYAVPGGATPARMDALEAVLSDYRGLAATVAAGRQVHTDICFFAGHTAYALARGWWILGRIQRAAQLYAEAAGFYEQAAQPADAADASEKARSLGYAVRSDIDGASVQDLRALVAGDTGPLIRARAHARLALLAAAANDVFDAAEWAEKAAGNLVEAGFPDPEAQPMDTVLDAWITTACRTASEPGAPAAFRLLTEIGQAWQSLLGARQARWVAPDPARAERTTAALAALNVALRQVAEQPAVANETVEAGLKRYFPLPFLPKRVEDEENADLPERMQAVADRLNAIKIEANAAEAAGNSAAFPDLLRRCAACVADARAMAIGATIGLACQIDAYVRLRAGDAPGSAAAAADGEAAILDGMPATPETMAGHPEFGLLLMLRGVRLQALGLQNDTPGLVALAEDSVQLIEAQRYRVSDPYQQGAFLAERTFFYEMAVFGSFRLGRWDGLLSAMELIKARAALLNRLSPPPAAPDADLARRLDAANAALATAPEGSDARLAAAEQRRLLLSLRAIERARQGKPDAVPTLSVAALQAALAPDEAVIAWVWIARRVLIVMALDAARVHVERVVLSDADRALLDAYVTAVRTERVNMRALDSTVTRLVAAVLPPDTREFVAAARRLILSPHRALHLLPFHAAKLGDSFLIEKAAIRYVPNLGSLLVPWPNPGAGDAPTDAATTGTAATTAAAGGVLALGVGTFNVPGETWVDLANAEAEARAVADVWASRGLPADVMTGAAASVAAFRALGPRLPAYRCLHLATHGSSVFATEAANDPFASRLILQDGALDALTVGRLRVNAEVVVLSACHSGQRALGGRGLAELPGDDVFGLQAALFEAGAHSVVGALWPVDDRIAPVIMAALHAGLAARMAPELALQEALLGYLRRPDARRGIYFWAPLFLSSIGRAAMAGETHDA